MVAPFFTGIRKTMDKLYSLKSAAEILDVSVKTLRRLIHSNNIPVCTVGSRIRIKKTSLLMLIVDQRSLDDYGIKV